MDHEIGSKLIEHPIHCCSIPQVVLVTRGCEQFPGAAAADSINDCLTEEPAAAGDQDLSIAPEGGIGLERHPFTLPTAAAGSGLFPGS